MSITEAAVCDGCGKTERVYRPKPGHKHVPPWGWVRLPVFTRTTDYVKRVGEVEVCSPNCATPAVERFFQSEGDS